MVSKSAVFWSVGKVHWKFTTISSLNGAFLLSLLICAACASLSYEATDESRIPLYQKLFQGFSFTGKIGVRKRDDNGADNTDTTPSSTKEPAPKFSFPVWDSNGKLCILAQFKAFLNIDYTSQGGKLIHTDSMPEDVTTKGFCGSSTRDPLLDVSWSSYTFRMTFSKIKPDDDSAPTTWAVTSIELIYNTADFPGATNGGKKTARSPANAIFFETPLGKSYFCPSPDVVTLTDQKKQVATVRFTDLQLQPFYIEKGKFSPFQRCSQVGLGGLPEPFAQDETVPIAVGSTLAVLAILVVIGYAVYRSILERRVEYNTME